MKTNILFKAIYILVIILLCFIYPGLSQTVISFEEAVILAQKNNPELKALQAQENMESSLIKAVNMLSPLQFTTTLGQFNSSYFDHSISLVQTFSTPGYYKAKKQWQRQKFSSSIAYRKWMERKMTRELEMIFIRYTYLVEKEKLLRQKDSLFGLFLEKVNLQVEMGEVGSMAKIMAEQQKFQTGYALSTNDQERKDVATAFGAFVANREDNWFLTYPFQVQKAENVGFDSLSSQHHPEVTFLREEQRLAAMSTRVETVSFWPSFSLGYQNTSIRGTGADNVMYTSGKRFHSLEVGVNIPLSYNAIRNQVQASRLREEAALYQLEFSVLEKETNYQKTLSRYQHLIGQISKFENDLLPGLYKLQEVSQSSLVSGQTNFLEYVLLLNQSFDLRMQYLELQYTAISERANLKYLQTN